MNLQSLLKGIFGNLFGEEGLNSVGIRTNDERDYTNFNNLTNNLAAKYTGSRLTDAEREANAWTASREDLAWSRQMEARETAYQTQVKDMLAAGINPMMASSGSGAVVPSASSASSVSPGSASLNLGGLISALVGIKTANADAKLKAAQASKAVADKEKAEADTVKSQAETASITQQYEYFEAIRNARAEGERLQNDLKRSEMRSIEQSISESRARENESLSQALLNNANADNIVYMRPFVAAELSARTDFERKQARAAVVSAAYQQGLIDSGVIAQSIKASNASISVDEAIAELNRVNALIAKGDKHALANELGLLDKIDFWARDVLGAIIKVVDSVPVNFVVK